MRATKYGREVGGGGEGVLLPGVRASRPPSHHSIPFIRFLRAREQGSSKHELRAGGDWFQRSSVDLLLLLVLVLALVLLGWLGCRTVVVKAVGLDEGTDVPGSRRVMTALTA